MVSKQFVGVNQYFHMKIRLHSFVDKTLSIFLHIKMASDWLISITNLVEFIFENVFKVYLTMSVIDHKYQWIWIKYSTTKSHVRIIHIYEIHYLLWNLRHNGISHINPFHIHSNWTQKIFHGSVVWKKNQVNIKYKG